ncbi:MAG: hypothetical protein NUW02_03150 [Candidatus Campbellbacteria bacterium]|nr:hypothetical protein [Candidatus Campbellbacteria bacterium]
MTPEEKKLLEETATLAKETNILVRKMYRHIMVGSVMRVVYWAIIIGASVGAFYLIQPYIDTIQSLTGNGDGEQSSIESFFNF